MTITLDLSEEQQDALDAAVSALNERDGISVTQEQYITQFGVNALLDSLTQSAYQVSVARLGAAASGLDYTKRKALIAQIESQLSPT